MLEELVKREHEDLDILADDAHESIDIDIKRQKAVIVYVAQLVEQNYDKFVNALILNKNQRSPEKVYEKIGNIISFLDGRVSYSLGAIFRGVVVIPKLDEYVELGWGEYIPQEDYFGLFLTDEGEKIVNGYRTSQGLKSLEETFGEDWISQRKGYHEFKNQPKNNIP